MRSMDCGSYSRKGLYGSPAVMMGVSPWSLVARTVLSAALDDLSRAGQTRLWLWRARAYDDGQPRFPTRRPGRLRGRGLEHRFQRAARVHRRVGVGAGISDPGERARVLLADHFKLQCSLLSHEGSNVRPQQIIS